MEIPENLSNPSETTAPIRTGFSIKQYLPLAYIVNDPKFTVQVLNFDRAALTLKIQSNSPEINFIKGNSDVKTLADKTVGDLENTESISSGQIILRNNGEDVLAISDGTLIAYAGIQGSGPNSGQARILVNSLNIKSDSTPEIPITPARARESGEVLANPNPGINDAPNSYDRHRGPLRDLRAAQNDYCNQQMRFHFAQHQDQQQESKKGIKNVARTPGYIAGLHQFQRLG